LAERELVLQPEAFFAIAIWAGRRGRRACGCGRFGQVEGTLGGEEEPKEDTGNV